MEENKCPMPRKDSAREELEDKVADLIAEALYERIVNKPASKKQKEHNEK